VRLLAENAARTVFDTCHCRDYARVDLRIDSDGVPWVLEINSMASLGGGGSFMLATRTAGYDNNATVNLLLDTARQRYATRAPSTPASPPLRSLQAATT
jgi:D-alanine-D-alanine ligase